VRLTSLKIHRLPRLILGALLAAVAVNLAGAAPSKPETNGYTAYAGSESCRDCHLDDYNLWAQSHHALAERVLRPATDRTAFDPARDLKLGNELTGIRLQDGQFKLSPLAWKATDSPLASSASSVTTRFCNT
jgi:hypothetical protein